MAAEAIVLWLCGIGALGGVLIKLASDLHAAGLI